MPTGGYQARRAPAHAGRLRAWERVTITVVFVLVAAGITVIMVLTAHPQSSAPAVPASSATPGGSGGPAAHRHGHQSRPAADERR
jgi:hypothetical protein